MTDPGMTRPVTLTVTNSSAVLLTSGGVHYDLSRVAPNVYAGTPYREQRLWQLQLGSDFDLDVGLQGRATVCYVSCCEFGCEN